MIHVNEVALIALAAATEKDLPDSFTGENGIMGCHDPEGGQVC